MNQVKFKIKEVRRGYKVSGRRVRCTIIYRVATDTDLIKQSNYSAYTRMKDCTEIANEFITKGESFCCFKDDFDLKKGKEIAYRRAYSNILGHIKGILKEEEKATKSRLEAINNSINLINEKLSKNHDYLIDKTGGTPKNNRK